jgi:uncharacterized DUF497 family protein
MAWAWDSAKNSANRRKHGLSFEIASLVFQDRLAVTVTDPYPDEERWRTLGMVGAVVILVVHTSLGEDDGGIEHGRIISARKATARETEVYFHGH